MLKKSLLLSGVFSAVVLVSGAASAQGCGDDPDCVVPVTLTRKAAIVGSQPLVSGPITRGKYILQSGAIDSGIVDSGLMGVPNILTAQDLASGCEEKYHPFVTVKTFPVNLQSTSRLNASNLKDDSPICYDLSCVCGEYSCNPPYFIQKESNTSFVRSTTCNGVPVQLRYIKQTSN